MIAADAFLAMFTMQILAMSVLYPSWFIRYSRRQATSIPAERLAQLYPGVDVNLDRERFFARYRALNTAIAVLGALLLAWLFSTLRHLDPHDGHVEVLISIYFVVQMLLPLGLYARRGIGLNKLRTGPLLEAKRTAVLQRRGLFDFVAPFSVSVALLSYFLFAAFALAVGQPIYIGGITLVYGAHAFVVYAVLYGGKPNPYESHADRMHTIGLVVKSCVYSCIACVVFFALSLSLERLELQNWRPFSLSVFFVTTALLCLMGMMAPAVSRSS
jgi:hypothetical protein